MFLPRRAAMVCLALAPAALACLDWGQTANAQAPPPARFRGTIQSIGVDGIHIMTRAGQEMTLRLPPKVQITALVPIGLDAIKPGSFIGSAAIPQKDGTLRAIEVHVFPEPMRGTGEGHRPFDLSPDSTMTNGTVGNVVVSNGRTLTVSYKGGEKTIFVPLDVPIMTYEPGDRSMLVPGAHVIIFASDEAGANPTATRISVGKNGLVPPM